MKRNLRSGARWPFTGIRNGWGMLNRHPLLGIEFPAYQKIWRLAGVDQIHVNGIDNKFWESDDSVVKSIHGLPDADVWGIPSILPVVLFWADGACRRWRDVAADADGRSSVYGRRRDHGASGRSGGGRYGAKAGVGVRR